MLRRYLASVEQLDGCEAQENACLSTEEPKSKNLKCVLESLLLELVKMVPEEVRRVQAVVFPASEAV